MGSEITTNLDLFSLGSIFYTILVGYWPYRTQSFFSEGDDYLDYVDKVNAFFRQGRFPDVDGLWGGSVMMGCWRLLNERVSKLISQFSIVNEHKRAQSKSWIQWYSSPTAGFISLRLSFALKITAVSCVWWK